MWIAALLALALPARANLPERRALEAALRESISASCAGVTVAIDPDLTRAAEQFVRGAQAGRAPILGSSLMFYAALESIEPTPLSGVAIVAPPERADRAVGDLFSRQCKFNRDAPRRSTNSIIGCSPSRSLDVTVQLIVKGISKRLS